MRLPSGCRFNDAGKCRHPGVGGDATDERCSSCRMYMGTPRGLGDVVHTVAKWTGAAAVVERMAPNGKCGCAERRAALNAAVPFTDKPTQG